MIEAYGLRMVDDGSLATQTIRFDADDVDYSQAAHLLNLATDSFMVPLDPVRVLVAKETQGKTTRNMTACRSKPFVCPASPRPSSATWATWPRMCSAYSRRRCSRVGYPDCARPGCQSRWRSIRPWPICWTARARCCWT